jgi:hypothetical protein
MYDQAVQVVLKNRRASISLVQRHLRIGYNRAARLLEQMENSGVVSPMQSNGNRDILVPLPAQNKKGCAVCLPARFNYSFYIVEPALVAANAGFGLAFRRAGQRAGTVQVLRAVTKAARGEFTQRQVKSSTGKTPRSRPRRQLRVRPSRQVHLDLQKPYDQLLQADGESCTSTTRT